MARPIYGIRVWLNNKQFICLSIRKVIVVSIAALVFSLVMVYIGVSSFNKEAKEKRSTEKGYSVGLVIRGFY